MPDLTKCVVTGYARNHDGSLKAGGKIRVHSVSKTGAAIESANNSIYESPASEADGLMTVEFPRACTAWISGPFKINGVDFSVDTNRNGRAVTIPDAATANLEDLPAAGSVPSQGLTVESDDSPLSGLFGILNFSTAFTVERNGLQADVDLADNPFPDYLTQGEADARYAPLSEAAARAAADTLRERWAVNFTADGDAYIPAREAMTVDVGTAAIGTGTVAYAKSTAAAPGTFNATTLPAALEAGAWLRVSVSSLSGFKAVELRRTA